MEHANSIYRCIETYSLIDRDRFIALYSHLQSCRYLEGDIAEVGVYRGGTSLGMALIAPEKRIHLFDTFEGYSSPVSRKPIRKVISRIPRLRR